MLLEQELETSKMESQRQEFQNHDPLKVANKATGHTIQPESLL